MVVNSKTLAGRINELVFRSQIGYSFYDLEIDLSQVKLPVGMTPRTTRQEFEKLRNARVKLERDPDNADITAVTAETRELTEKIVKANGL